MVMEKHIGSRDMNTQFHTKFIVACVSAAIAQLSAVAKADSGVGVDTILGNAMNPYTSSTGQQKDPDGLGQNTNSRSPTGLLAQEPSVVKEPNKTNSGWQYNGYGEVGVLGGDADKKNAVFRKYKDLNNGVYLDNFGIQAEKPDAAGFVEVFGGSVGRKDQFYGTQFGRYNDWKVKLFYNETNHVFTDSFKSFWVGAGTGSLTLPGNIPAAAGATANGANFNSTSYGLTNATQATVNTAVANRVASTAIAADTTELSLVRKKGGMRFDMNLGEQWKVYGAYSDEKRQGARPFGATWGGGGGNGNLEIVEPIDYNTHDFLAGIQFADALSAFNARLSASLFRNNIGTLTFQNPFLPATANGISGSAFTGGTFDLYPNNNFYNLDVEYARSLPNLWNSRFTGAVTLSSMRQNDSLIAPTTLSGVTVANGSYAPVGSWNSASSLSKSSADAKIDTKLVDLGLSLNPISPLTVKGKVRYYETSNSTDYSACNPLTGQWGRLLNDGTGGAFATFVQSSGAALTAGQQTALGTFLAGNGCNFAALSSYLAAHNLVPAAGNINIHNVPYEYKQLIYGLSGDYKLNKYDTVNAAWEREEYKRKYRERDKTWEDKFKVGYVNRHIEDGTIRLSFEADRRRGGTYNPDPYEAFYSVSLGSVLTATGTNMSAWVHNIDQFRKFDLANRDQNILNARFNYAFRPDLDGGVSLQLKDQRFPDSDYGRNDHTTQNSLNFDLNWQPSTDLTVTGFYSYQDARIKQANVQPNACVIGTTYYFLPSGLVTTTVTAGVPSTTVTAANWEAVCSSAGPTSPLYPTSRGWNVTQTDHYDTVGLGLKYDFTKARLNLDYSFTFGKTGVSYSYNGTGLGLTAAAISAAGAGWPDMKFIQHTIDANLLVPINKTTSAHFLWHYEWGKVKDWHYDGVAANPTPGTAVGNTAGSNLYLDTGPQTYHSSVIGAFVKFDL
jgi:hypothetical protein